MKLLSTQWALDNSVNQKYDLQQEERKAGR